MYDPGATVDNIISFRGIVSKMPSLHQCFKHSNAFSEIFGIQVISFTLFKVTVTLCMVQGVPVQHGLKYGSYGSIEPNHGCYIFSIVGKTLIQSQSSKLLLKFAILTSLRAICKTRRFCRTYRTHATEALKKLCGVNPCELKPCKTGIPCTKNVKKNPQNCPHYFKFPINQGRTI